MPGLKLYRILKVLLSVKGVALPENHRNIEISADVLLHHKAKQKLENSAYYIESVKVNLNAVLECSKIPSLDQA